MPLSDQRHTARFPLPHLIRRGIDTLIQCEVYLDADLTAPSSGVVTIFDVSNNEVVSSAVTITDSVANYTVTAGTTSGLILGDGWRAEWVLTVGTDTLRCINEAALCRQVIRPPLSSIDLYRRVPALDPNSASVITASTSYQYAIDEAHVIISTRLLQGGKRPWLIMSPASLRPVYMALSLSIVFEDLSSRVSNVDYMERAREYKQEYSAAFKALNFAYDRDEDGTADLNSEGDPDRVGMASVFLTSRACVLLR